MVQDLIVVCTTVCNYLYDTQKTRTSQYLQLNQSLDCYLSLDVCVLYTLNCNTHNLAFKIGSISSEKVVTFKNYFIKKQAILLHTSEIISPHYGELQVQERQVNLIYIFWQKRGTEYTYEKLWREKSFRLLCICGSKWFQACEGHQNHKVM